MTASSKPNHPKLAGIQALRGLAACAVVLSHSARHLDKDHGSPWLITVFEAGHAGVDLFFVLSGFIILFIHHRDVGRERRLARYARRRFERVMPLYWIALGLTVAMGVAGGHGLPALPWIAWSVTLLPTLREPLLGIAWTLQFEIVFYILFAILIVNRTLGAIALAGWAVWIGLGQFVAQNPYVPAPFFSVFGLEFFMGMGAAWLLISDRVHLPRTVLVVSAVAFVGALVLESAGHLNGFGTAARFAYGIPAAGLVAGSVAAEQAGRLTAPTWLRPLGEASYSIYLFQFVFIGTAWQVLRKLGLAAPGMDLVCFAVLAGSAIGGGLAASRFVEQPLLRSMRQASRRDRHGEPGLVTPRT